MKSRFSTNVFALLTKMFTLQLIYRKLEKVEIVNISA